MTLIQLYLKAYWTLKRKVVILLTMKQTYNFVEVAKPCNFQPVSFTFNVLFVELWDKTPLQFQSF